MEKEKVTSLEKSAASAILKNFKPQNGSLLPDELCKAAKHDLVTSGDITLDWNGGMGIYTLQKGNVVFYFNRRRELCTSMEEAVSVPVYTPNVSDLKNATSWEIHMAQGGLE